LQGVYLVSFKLTITFDLQADEIGFKAVQSNSTIGRRWLAGSRPIIAKYTGTKARNWKFRANIRGTEFLRCNAKKFASGECIQ
jgi:hypothetical protein